MNEINEKQSFIDRLKLSMNKAGIRPVDLAIKSQIPLSSISAILHGRIPNPRAQNVVALAKAVGVTAEYLVLGDVGEAQENARQAILSNNEQNAFSDYLPLKLSSYNVKTQSWNELSNIASVYIQKSVFESEGIPSKSCRALRFQGGSMAPTIENNSIVLLNCNDTNQIIDDCIYAFVDTGFFKIKRLRNLRDGVQIISDAANYTPDQIEGKDFKENFRLVGRVIYSVTRH